MFSPLVFAIDIYFYILYHIRFFFKKIKVLRIQKIAKGRVTAINVKLNSIYTRTLSVGTTKKFSKEELLIIEKYVAQTRIILQKRIVIYNYKLFKIQRTLGTLGLKVWKPINKAKLASRRVEVIQKQITDLKKKLSNPHEKINRFEIQKIIIPSLELQLAKRIIIYNRTLYATVPNSLGVYLNFFAHVREYFSYLLLHFYIPLFILSLFCNHMHLTFTYANFTDGFQESTSCWIILFILMFSFCYINTHLDKDGKEVPDDPVFADCLQMAVNVSKFIKVYLGVFVFRQACIGKSLCAILLSNPLFTITVDSIVTSKLGIPVSVIPIILDNSNSFGIMFDIPTIHYVT